jgi:hypothetical protein
LKNSFIFTGRSKWMQNAEQEARHHRRTLSTSSDAGLRSNKVMRHFQRPAEAKSFRGAVFNVYQYT